MLIIGLGNPGEEYVGTRHNVGREVVDALASHVGAGLHPRPFAGGTTFRTKRTLHAEILECELAGQQVILVKPTTYMNDSGRAITALTKKYTLSLSKGNEPLVVHDDLDLSIGALRLSVGGSSGGHKGVQSIIAALRTENFLRLRVGIGPNATPDGHRIPAEDFVLKRFGKEERGQIDAAITRTVEVILTLIRDGLSAAQQLANNNS